LYKKSERGHNLCGRVKHLTNLIWKTKKPGLKKKVKKK